MAVSHTTLTPVEGMVLRLIASRPLRLFELQEALDETAPESVKSAVLYLRRLGYIHPRPGRSMSARDWFYELGALGLVALDRDRARQRVLSIA